MFSVLVSKITQYGSSYTYYIYITPVCNAVSSTEALCMNMSNQLPMMALSTAEMKTKPRN